MHSTGIPEEKQRGYRSEVIEGIITDYYELIKDIVNTTDHPENRAWSKYVFVLTVYWGVSSHRSRKEVKVVEDKKGNSTNIRTVFFTNMAINSRQAYLASQAIFSEETWATVIITIWLGGSKKEGKIIQFSSYMGYCPPQSW